jgi:TolB protein
LLNKLIVVLLSLTFIFSCSSDNDSDYLSAADSLRFDGEVHLRNIKQLTFGGNNAEAYWSFDNEKLVFQSDWDKINKQGCDQIFVMNADGSKLGNGKQYQLVSTGLGRTTCSYFLTDGRIIYSSTHAADEACPEAPMFMGGRYVWAIYDTYDIYVTDKNYQNSELLIGGEGYDAEPTVSPDGKYIIFTSTRSGDLELWRYEIATKKLLQLTSELGYDGGAFFSHDSKKIVWRASRPTGERADIYKDLLKNGFVEPKALNIFIADIDGKNVVQVTNMLGANWAPYFHPSNQKIVFASNHHSLKEGGRIFDIFLINIDGTGLQQITNSGTFDAFPMFSHDGNKLAFASNRRADEAESRETNVFVADWIEKPIAVDLNFQKPNRVASK